MAITKLTSGLAEEISELINLGYAMLQYSFIVFGALALAAYISRRKIGFRDSCDVTLPKKSKLKAMLLNPGVIVFYLICAETMLISIATEVITYYLGG